MPGISSQSWLGLLDHQCVDLSELHDMRAVILRKLMVAMEKNLPMEQIKKDGVLCCGGDIRAKRNRWLSSTLQGYERSGRLCRERKFRSIVSLLDWKHKLCQGLTARIASIDLRKLCPRCCVTTIQAAGPKGHSVESWITEEVPPSEHYVAGVHMRTPSSFCDVVLVEVSI